MSSAASSSAATAGEPQAAQASAAIEALLQPMLTVQPSVDGAPLQLQLCNHTVSEHFPRTAIDLLAQSRWAAQVGDLVLKGDAPLLKHSNSAQLANAMWKKTFPLLTSLTLERCNWIDVFSLVGCLEALRNQLRTLRIDIDGIAPNADHGRVLRGLGLMCCLEELELHQTPKLRAPQQPDEPSSPLDNVNWEEFATVVLRKLSMRDVFPFKSPPALRSLARCLALTQLDVDGSWTDVELRTFADSRPAGAAHLQSLRLPHTHVTEKMWPVLTEHFGSLTELQVGPFRLPAAQWAELPRAFPQLCSFSLAVAADPGGIDWVSAVARCKHLTKLQLFSVFLSRKHLEQLVNGLPQLSELKIENDGALESVAPLASAHALTSLKLNCRFIPSMPGTGQLGVPGLRSKDWRPELELPRLRRLDLYVPSDVAVRGNEAESAARRVALLARMPQLAAANYSER